MLTRTLVRFDFIVSQVAAKLRSQGFDEQALVRKLADDSFRPKAQIAKALAGAAKWKSVTTRRATACVEAGVKVKHSCRSD